ncbi:ARM repeat-containing protein [Peniophora sp. CONT]|nr:ARM repeat-containing protein [Peniophora sp. CONT]
MERDEEDEMQVDGDGEGKVAKDPNAARESHKAQRQLAADRRASKPHASILLDAKSHWALARQKNITKPERQKHISALMDSIRGRVQDIVFKHDASRIVQTLVKWGDQGTRDEVAGELQGRYRELAQNKYSKFLVTKLARLCPSHRTSIILELKPHVLRLILHREASRALADIYELYANAYERSLLVRELYGRETALFATKATLEDKDAARAGLAGVLGGLDLEQQRRVLKSVRESLQQVLSNPDKGAVRHALVHRALWEYLSALPTLPDQDEATKLRAELLESAMDQLAEMVHTKDGSRAVREFIARGDAKQRKGVLKVLKPYVETMAKDDEAQLVLFTALDVVDDTKLLAKSIVSPITSSAPTLHTTAAGRRALLYPLAPRSTRHFTPALSASLAETDSIRALTSKKDTSARQAEVRTSASAELIDWVERHGAEVVRDTGGSLVVLEIMLSAEGEKGEASKALLQPLAVEDGEDVDMPHVARMHKALLQGGHFSRSTGTIEKAERWDAGAYAKTFVEVVGKDRTKAMARGTGAFVVAELLERVRVDGDAKVRGEMRMWFEGFEGEEGESVKGWSTLIEKVEALRKV